MEYYMIKSYRYDKIDKKETRVIMDLFVVKTYQEAINVVRKLKNKYNIKSSEKRFYDTMPIRDKKGKTMYRYWGSKPKIVEMVIISKSYKNIIYARYKGKIKNISVCED